jgi:hypothetical protein
MHSEDVAHPPDNGSASMRRRRLVAGCAIAAVSDALPLYVRPGMVHAYDDRASVIATAGQVLAGSPLQPDFLECVIADSLAGAAPAKTAWRLATSQEDLS